MARQAKSRFPRTSCLTRRTDWAVGPRGIISASAASVNLFPTAISANSDGTTLIRIRGDLNVFLPAAAASLDGFRVGFGICRVTDKAVAVGSTAVPGPLTEKDWDGWIFYQLASIKNVGGAVGGSVGSDSLRITIDSKSMRKWSINDSIVGVMETASEVGTATIQAELDTRCLFKLP